MTTSGPSGAARTVSLRRATIAYIIGVVLGVAGGFACALALWGVKTFAC